MAVDPNRAANHLGVAVDERLTDACDAATAWVEQRRCNTDPLELWADEGVNYGGMLYACLLYQSRTTPQGFAGYDELLTSSPTSAEALWRARDLVGQDPVIA